MAGRSAGADTNIFRIAPYHYIHVCLYVCVCMWMCMLLTWICFSSFKRCWIKTQTSLEYVFCCFVALTSTLTHTRTHTRTYTHTRTHTRTRLSQIELGPMTFIRQDNEKVILGPDRMVTVPPRHYCVVENPVALDAGTCVCVCVCVRCVCVCVCVCVCGDTVL